MLRVLKRAAAPVAAAALLALVPSALRANSIDVTSETITGTGPYVYNFTESVSASSNIQTGDYFVIYDFYGYNGVNTLPLNWSLTTVATTGTITTSTGDINVPDSPAAPDLKLTYTGTAQINGLSSLGTFSFGTSQGSTVDGVQVGVDHGNLTGKPEGNTFGILTPAPTPLPATASTGLSLLGGIACVAGLNKARRRQLA